MEFREQLQSPPLRGPDNVAGAALRWFVEASDYLTVIGVTGILLCLVLLMGHYTTFFLVDQDIKYLAAASLSHHWNNAAISYPFHLVDPHGVYALPLTAWIHGHEYAGYSLPFEYLGAVSLWAFGTAGLALPALVGTVILLFVQIQMASLLGLEGRRSLLFGRHSAGNAAVLLFDAVLGTHLGHRPAARRRSCVTHARRYGSSKRLGWCAGWGFLCRWRAHAQRSADSRSTSSDPDTGILSDPQRFPHVCRGCGSFGDFAWTHFRASSRAAPGGTYARLAGARAWRSRLDPATTYRVVDFR